MSRRNMDIREAARKKGVLLWEVADRLGIHDSGLSKVLRYELPTERKAELLRIIDEIARTREGEVAVNG
jgi:hypothetical protein